MVSATEVSENGEHTNSTRTPARWTITSATKAYKWVQGEGIERENPPHYTVQTLIGGVMN